ncbi:MULTISPECIES: heme ABC exporter ATP-binding protein CcmA [unclassified Sphingomonas]|uniref:heme ABC exporter ATP-binding protein CcmA n=1 Tax=unclassified Sphingomonas TaxID=196159 RepID=UPI0006F3E6EB|nr:MULTISPECIES: heme ABC exporter ATP-binding protein CcmA [unclassified Sphingomonas]KQM58910.1 cytochrome C biogenesis protein CcmA [Sphingomonas sp. Leaf16]KQN11165.1 cytochrome C biogenesis protein CcmA [Sphingomonas sp. Leaf29]KQN18464.1 cytochrome C biogenesis protein CcmA [Sphingomonas sp. Leaf32]
MILSFAEVTGARGGRVLFRDLSFDLGAGEALWVQGPNGVGKSTLVRIAAGLLPPAAGSVTRNGAVALLAEAAALDTSATLGAALDFWAGLDGARDRLPAALTAMAIETLADVPVRMLSTGQKRRAAIARVIASGAPLWLVDEPANGLDAASLDRLESAIAAHRGGGGAVLVASHVAVALPAAKIVAL